MAGFGEDGAGHLYAVSLSGPVYRLVQPSPDVLATQSVGNFAQPVAVAAPPGDPDRLFVVEKAGRIQLRTGSTVTEFLDITALVGDDGGEEGLLAFAVAPDYGASGRVFAYYTDNNGDLQLDEFTRTAAGPDSSSAATRRPLLTIPHAAAANHNGGQLLFGPDGSLYLSTGDGGIQGDPEGDAQNLGSLLGKILRLDVGYTSVPPTPPRPCCARACKRRQRVLRLRGAVARVSCNERCSIAAGGRLKIGRRSFRMRRVSRAAQAGNRARIRVALSRRGRRALRRALQNRRRAGVRLSLRATDAAGNRSRLVRRSVRVRR